MRYMRQKENNRLTGEVHKPNIRHIMGAGYRWNLAHWKSPPRLPSDPLISLCSNLPDPGQPGCFGGDWAITSSPKYEVDESEESVNLVVVGGNGSSKRNLRDWGEVDK